MSINDFVEMTISLCLICFSICAKMQDLVDEFFFFISLYFKQKFKMEAKNDGKTLFGESRQ